MGLEDLTNMGTQERLQGVVKNVLGEIGDRRVTGLIGSHPSTYSASWKMWNNVYRNPEINMDVIYLNFDLGALADGKPDLDALDRYMGVARELGEEGTVVAFNVTMNYKNAIIKHLDRVDPLAAATGAVNTVVVINGELYGYNTDGVGEMDNLTNSLEPGKKPLVSSFDGMSALVIGAGGASDAVTLALAGKIGESGNIYIANRTGARALELSEKARNYYKKKGINVKIVGGGLEEIPNYLLQKPDLVLNTTSVGNSGEFEGYSAIAPTYPGEDGVRRNNEESLELISKVPKTTGFADTVYSPEESVFLRHARETGHETLNGEGMLVFQAVHGFMIVHEKEIADRGITREEITRLMHSGFVRK